MDCEGCEYGVFSDMKDSIHDIDMILTEFHFASSLGLGSHADVEKASEVFQLLHGKYEYNYFHTNNGHPKDQNTIDILNKHGIEKHKCCREVILTKKH